MSKLHCYERTYRREKIIELIKYSRKERKLKQTCRDHEILEKVSLRKLGADHYDQARSDIDRIQATIPGQAGKKTENITRQLRLL